MKQLQAACGKNLERHLRKLTVDIGVRLAGSPAETLTTDYLEQEFRKAGASTTIETFPVLERAVQRENLHIRIGEQWHSFPCSLFSNTPGTDGELKEAPLCFFEAATEYQRQDLNHLRGKAVVHLGCHIESRENYQRLMAAEPAFLLFVDVRYPGTIPLADGMFPAYTSALGAVPTMNVAYMDAWRWKVEGASAARLVVEGGMRESTSRNVIAELPGSDPDAGVLFLGGHHDTQANSVGADDNGVGTVMLLELARLLAPLPRQRTIRLIAFGAEEQLSVGSASYVRRHRPEVESQGRVMFNMDSFASQLGWNTLVWAGPQEMPAALIPHFQKHDLYMKLMEEIVPYTDQFPFAAAGVPGVYLGRDNCTAGRFFHHRHDDDMSRVSIPLMTQFADAIAELIHFWSKGVGMPFAAEIPDTQARQVQAFWEDLFGGWSGV